MLNSLRSTWKQRDSVPQSLQGHRCKAISLSKASSLQEAGAALNLGGCTLQRADCQQVSGVERGLQGGLRSAGQGTVTTLCQQTGEQRLLQPGNQEGYRDKTA